MAYSIPVKSTLSGCVLRWAERDPRRTFAHFWNRNGEVFELSYEELATRARRYASLFAAHGVRPGEVVVLIQKQDADLLAAFVGALLHGALPSIFAFPTPKISRELYLNTLDRLLESCGARAVVASERFLSELSSIEAWRKSVLLLGATEAGAQPPAPLAGARDSEEVAFLQHSSGTTGLKKGVALQHGAVTTQLTHLAEALELASSDHIVSWLPLYHDMGLIACFLLPLCCAVPVTFIDPFDWVADPALLLEATDGQRATLCWLPNFAYNFLAKRVTAERGVGLDLSSLRGVINCAEPISAQSHELFYSRFRGHGLRRSALCASYAMAENTFAVTQGGISAPTRVERIDESLFEQQHLGRLAGPETRRVREVVSSGAVLPGNEVRIVDSARRALSTRQVGEIAIRGDSLFSGYFNRDDLTRAAMDEDGWYYTGDLGYLADGELFVTGRSKDLIIVAGKNIYPQDIEELVSTVEGVVPGRVVAFGVADPDQGTEQVVVIAETREPTAGKEAAGLRFAIAGAVRRDLECVAKEVLLAPHMWLQKSSSGKISRRANCARYVQGQRPPALAANQRGGADARVFQTTA